MSIQPAHRVALYIVVCVMGGVLMTDRDPTMAIMGFIQLVLGALMLAFRLHEALRKRQP